MTMTEPRMIDRIWQERHDAMLHTNRPPIRVELTTDAYDDLIDGLPMTKLTEVVRDKMLFGMRIRIWDGFSVPLRVVTV